MIKSNRVVFFDYLRIIAAISVVFLHVSAAQWYTTDVNIQAWFVMSAYNGLQRWNVPVFVMISGALFLGKEISLKQLYSKKIIRMIIVFIFWSLLYACWDFLTIDQYGIKHFIREVVFGHYHLWFLYMLVGLYMIVPLLSIIVKNNRLTKYFLILALVFAFTLPGLNDIIGQIVPRLSEVLTTVISKIQLNFVLGYSGYFVLGFFLSRSQISRKTEIIIYILGLLGVIFTIGATFGLSNWLNLPMGCFLGNLTLNTFIVSVAVFTFFKQHLNKPVNSPKTQNLIMFISKCTFGVYLIHPFFIEALNKFANINTLSFNPIISIPVISIVVFLASLMVSILFNKIPVLNKWIV